MIIIITIKLLFTGSLGSKYNEISEFYKLLCEFKMHSVITIETEERKKGL